MRTFVLKRKSFTDMGKDGFPTLEEWMKETGVKFDSVKDDKGNFTKYSSEAFKNSKAAYETAKEEYNKKILALKKGTIFNSVKKFVKENKVPIGVAAAAIATAGAGVGGYKYLKNRDREEKISKSNDSLRRKIAGYDYI